MTSSAPPILSGQTVSHHLLLEHAMRSRRHAAMIEAEQPAEALATDDVTTAMADGVDRCDEDVAQRLVIPFAGIVNFVGAQRAVERRRAEEDHLPQALGLHGLHPALGDRVAVRRSWRTAQRGHAGALEDVSERGAEPRVPVEDQESRVPKEAVDGVGQDAGELPQEFVRVDRGRDDADGTGGMVDDEEGVMGHELSLIHI